MKHVYATRLQKHHKHITDKLVLMINHVHEFLISAGMHWWFGFRNKHYSWPFCAPLSTFRRLEANHYSVWLFQVQPFGRPRMSSTINQGFFSIQNNEWSGVWSPIEMFMNAIRCVALNLSPRSHQWSRTSGPVYRDWDHFTRAWYDVDLIPKFPLVYSPPTACFPCAMFIESRM